MGNCFKDMPSKKEDCSASYRSSLSYREVRETLHIKDALCHMSPTFRKSPLLDPQLNKHVILEEQNQEIEAAKSPRYYFDEILELQNTTTTDSPSIYELGPQVFSRNLLKLQHLATGQTLHSHFVKHEHNRLNEVSVCQEGDHEHDWWQFQNADDTLENQSIIKVIRALYIKCIQLVHPLTNCLLICTAVPEESNMQEVNCCSKCMSPDDQWEIELVTNHLSTLHLNSIISNNRRRQHIYTRIETFEEQWLPQGVKCLWENRHASQSCGFRQPNSFRSVDYHSYLVKIRHNFCQ